VVTCKSEQKSDRTLLSTVIRPRINLEEFSTDTWWANYIFVRHNNTGAALASGSTSGGFQDGHPGACSTCNCPAWLHHIWPPTVSWSPSPTKIVVSCVLPHQGCVLSDGPPYSQQLWTATKHVSILWRRVL